jgi:hypothetical protein
VDGTLERQPIGYDFNGASFAVFHGDRRVYAMEDIGEIRGDGYMLLQYGAQHPFCDVEAVTDGVELVVKEIG